MLSRRSLRVAVFSYSLPVTGRKRGGIERVAHELADGLARRGHEVVVFTHDPAPRGAHYTVSPLPWAGFVETWLGRRLTMGYLGNLLAILPDYAPFDAVVAHGDSLLLPLRGKPIVRILHGSALGEAWSARSVGRFLLQSGIYVQELLTALVERGSVAVSENARRHNPLVRTVIPNGVDLDRFHPDASERSAYPSIVFVGSLRGRKRGSLLLEAFDVQVRARFSDARLFVVGEAGPARPGVSYHTGIEDDELAALYRRAWVYASPSVYEGFGLPYLEAMACGTPVLAVANPGSRELLGDGRYGALVPIDWFADALTALLADADRRAVLSQAGRTRAASYGLEAMIAAYEARLYELIDGRAAVVSVPTK